jgi:pimeloyl-ACP methyl ester carboxylesterase
MSTTAGRIARAYAMGPYGQIHYRRSGPTGARSPLLLLHPFPSSGYVFEEFMAEMGHDRSVIAPDLPGFGMTDRPRMPPTIAHYAAAMLELVAEMGLGIADVMGYHTGGMVAAEMAHQQPNVVRKIVMISAPIFTDDELKQARSRPAAFSPDDRAAGMGQGWLSFKNDFWRMGNGDERTWNLYLEGQRNPDSSAWGHQAMLAYNLAAVLPGIPQPVLVLNPDDDLKGYTPRVKPLLKNGRVHDLPGWTHGFLDSKTGETAAIVRGFLDGA